MSTPRLESQSSPAGARGRRRWPWIVVGVGILVASLAVARAARRPAPDARQSTKGTADGAGREHGGSRAGGRPVPIRVVAAQTQDLPITLEGLGTVTAYKTVNVRPQVDGRLDRVTFTEGQTVKRGDLLAQIDPRPFSIQLHQAEAALQRDRAQLGGAERNLERYDTVVRQRLIPQQQADDQHALVDQLRGTVAADQAQIENARLLLSYARITAPIDGVTGVRQVDPGNLVRATDATGIVVITQMDPIAVLFTLPQDDLARVIERQRQAPLTVEALSRDGTHQIAKGQLALVDNQINTTTATIRLKAVFANPDRALWPNQFVKTRLLVDVRGGALVIPAVAVQRGPQGAFVYTTVDDAETTHVTMTPLDVDTVVGEQAVVAKGLAAGTRVVVEGQNQLRPGAAAVVLGAEQAASHPHRAADRRKP